MGTGNQAWTCWSDWPTTIVVRADYLLGLTDDPRPANKQAMSEAAVDAINLIDSLPPEKRPATVDVLRAMIELMEVGVPLPEPVESRDGGG